MKIKVDSQFNILMIYYGPIWTILYYIIPKRYPDHDHPRRLGRTWPEYILLTFALCILPPKYVLISLTGVLYSFRVGE